MALLWLTMISETALAASPIYADGDLPPLEAEKLLQTRSAHPGLQPHPDLPDDTRLWAALQQASGGTWAGCVYDVEQIEEVIKAGLSAMADD